MANRLLIARNTPENLYQVSDKVWMTKPRTLPDGNAQGINVCIKLEDDSFAVVAFLLLYPNGVYYNGDTPLGDANSLSFQKFINTFTETGVGLSSNIDDPALFQKVCEAYKEKNSIKGAAIISGISEQKARRILITEGLYTCPQYETIKKLLEEGNNIKEISKQIKMSENQIRAYLPYNSKYE